MGLDDHTTRTIGSRAPLARGATGPAVAALQSKLNDAGAALAVDGVWGAATASALRAWQAAHDLRADGVLGPKTQAALAGGPRALSPADIERAARALGADVAAIRAVSDVEARGSGFIDGGIRPIILYERHIMVRRLRAHDLDARAAAAAHPDLVNTAPGGYAGGLAEWSRFARAAAIARDCAIEATSWGAFQILGEHWRRLGYASAERWVAAMHRSAGAQLAAFVAFIRADDALRAALAARDWAGFAARYNGPNYAEHDYAGRLAAAWRHHSGRAPERAGALA